SALTFSVPVGAADSSAIEAIASCAGSMKNAYLSVMPRLLKPLAWGSSWGLGVMSSHSLSSVMLNRSESFFSSPKPRPSVRPSREWSHSGRPMTNSFLGFASSVMNGSMNDRWPTTPWARALVAVSPQSNAPTALARVRTSASLRRRRAAAIQWCVRAGATASAHPRGFGGSVAGSGAAPGPSGARGSASTTSSEPARRAAARIMALAIPRQRTILKAGAPRLSGIAQQGSVTPDTHGEGETREQAAHVVGDRDGHRAAGHGGKRRALDLHGEQEHDLAAALEPPDAERRAAVVAVADEELAAAGRETRGKVDRGDGGVPAARAEERGARREVRHVHRAGREDRAQVEGARGEGGRHRRRPGREAELIGVRARHRLAGETHREERAAERRPE